MKALKKLLKAMTKEAEEGTPYVVEHPVAERFQFSKDFEVGKFKNLLSCQLVVQGSVRKVVSFWKNQDSYMAAARPFQATLGSAGPVIEGFHCDMRTKEVRLWRRVSVLSVILFITTVLGFWKTMNDQFEEWFERPELEISSESPGPIRIAVNTDSEVQLLFRNQSLSTRSTLGEVRCYLRHGQTNLPLFNSSRVLAMEKGEMLKQKVPLKITKAGNYVLRAQATIKTGKFTAKKTQTNDIPLQVWPEFAFEPARVILTTSNKCSATVNLISGAGASQVKCEALLTNYQGACFENVVPIQGTSEIYCDKFSKKTAMEWATAAMGAFRARTFTLFLKSDRLTSDFEWSNLVERIEFNAVNQVQRN